MSSRENPFEKQVELQRIEPRVRGPKIANDKSVTPCRQGKRGIPLYFDVDTHKLLRDLAWEQEKSITALLFEGTNLMLRHYGKKPIA